MIRILRQRQLRLHRRSGGTPTASPACCSSIGLLVLLGLRPQLQHRVHRRHAGPDRDQAPTWTSAQLRSGARRRRASSAPRSRHFGSDQRVRRSAPGRRPRRHRRRQHPGRRPSAVARRARPGARRGAVHASPGPRRSAPRSAASSGRRRCSPSCSRSSRCWPTSPSGSSGASASRPSSPRRTTSLTTIGFIAVHAPRGEPGGGRRGALDGRLLAQRHDHHLRPGPREPAQVSSAMPFSTILNRSINETLPRSVLTHGTTLVDAARAGDLRRRGDPARSRWSCSSASSPARSRRSSSRRRCCSGSSSRWPGAARGARHLRQPAPRRPRAGRAGGPRRQAAAGRLTTDRPCRADRHPLPPRATRRSTPTATRCSRGPGRRASGTSS